MPTTRHHLDDFAIDTAQLGAPLSDASLDALDDVLSARDAARDLVALLEHAQQQLESGAHPYLTREQFAVDLEMALGALRHHVASILGADGNA